MICSGLCKPDLQKNNLHDALRYHVSIITVSCKTTLTSSGHFSLRSALQNLSSLTCKYGGAGGGDNQSHCRLVKNPKYQPTL